jgi:hypothetical protein
MNSGRAISFGLVVLMIVALVAVFGCSSETEIGEPIITPTPEVTPDSSTPLPEDVIPLNVSGFNFSRKYDWSIAIFDGEEYSASSIFLPKADSEFMNEVENLQVGAYLFTDEESASEAVDILIEYVDIVTEIQVNDTQALLTYREGLGEASAIQQHGRLVIISNTMPPLGVADFNQEVLQNAVINGLEASRL